MYRIIYRGGDYRDEEHPPSFDGAYERRNIWAVIHLDIVDGGDAHQALLRTLRAEAI